MDNFRDEATPKEIKEDLKLLTDEKDKEIVRLNGLLNEYRKQSSEKDRRIDNLTQLVDKMKDIIENNTISLNRQLDEAMSDFYLIKSRKEPYRNAPNVSSQQPVPELMLIPKKKNTFPQTNGTPITAIPATIQNNNSVKSSTISPLVSSVKSKGTSSPDRSPSASDLKPDKLTPKANTVPDRKGIKFPVAKKSSSVGAITTPSEESVPRYTRLEDFIGRIFTLSKNQAASRFLQKKLDDDPTNVNIIFDELYQNLISLMTDQAGQHVCKKLLECADPDKRNKIFEKVLPEVVVLSKDKNGTYVVQKIIELQFLNPDQIDQLIDALNSDLLNLIKDETGTYVIHCCLTNLPPEKNQFIYTCVRESCVDLSFHKVGCIVLKKAIERGTYDQRIELVSTIIAADNFLEIIKHQFGNYVVQCVLEKAHDYVGKVVDKMSGHIPELCMQKSSSNVVEKALQEGDTDTRRRINDEIFKQEILPKLSTDKFANFVIQTALRFTDPEQHKELLNSIPQIEEPNSPYVKPLLNTLFK
jgi:hypothetical protein